MIPIRTCITTVRHSRLYEGNNTVLNFIEAVREYSHINVFGTIGGVGAYDF